LIVTDTFTIKYHTCKQHAVLLLLQGITFVESTGNFLAIEEVRNSEKHDELHPFTHELRITDNGTQYETVQVRCTRVAVEVGLRYRWLGGSTEGLFGLIVVCCAVKA
jgi:hypothetical protein